MKIRTIDAESDSLGSATNNVYTCDRDISVQPSQSLQTRGDVEFEGVKRDLADTHVGHGIYLTDEEELGLNLICDIFGLKYGDGQAVATGAQSLHTK